MTSDSQGGSGPCHPLSGSAHGLCLVCYPCIALDWAVIGVTHLFVMNPYLHEYLC